MLLGVIALEAKPKYRIETWVYNGERYYQPQQKVWYKNNYFYLPFKIWKSGQYPLKNQNEAEWIIQNWEDEYQSKRNYKRSQFIEVK
jgi:hypothetical protein